MGWVDILRDLASRVSRCGKGLEGLSDGRSAEFLDRKRQMCIFEKVRTRRNEAHEV